MYIFILSKHIKYWYRALCIRMACTYAMKSLKGQMMMVTCCGFINVSVMMQCTHSLSLTQFIYKFLIQSHTKCYFLSTPHSVFNIIWNIMKHRASACSLPLSFTCLLIMLVTDWLTDWLARFDFKSILQTYYIYSPVVVVQKVNNQ